KPADDICDEVVAQLKSTANVTTTYSSGTNTLLKLSKKASALSEAKTQCNYSSLESAYQTAYSAYESAEQTYEQYSDAVDQAKEQLDQAEEQLSSASTSDTLDELESQLDECELKAQQDGTVITLNATVGSSATGMSAVATISNLDKLKVSITIEEADINNAVTGLSCYITSDASEDTLNGTLTQIDPTAGESGSFGAEVTVDSETDELRIGMNASVEILVSSTEDVYQVPIDAVGNDDDGNGDYVYRQTGGEGTDMTFEKIYVTTGDQNDYYIEIESDELSEGDVIRSSADLTEGIETGETSDSSDDSSSLFGSLFSSLGGNSGGGMSGGDMPSGGSSSGGGRGSSDFSGGNFGGGGMQ
ncbi:MAG: efflux RND transporter periplasmic adaptor subunit, partial [Clostridiales bacterium]|nr:efflux RND transporter periplasmic adaptor subunit [Clostridiales bacterium]